MSETVDIDVDGFLAGYLLVEFAESLDEERVVLPVALTLLCEAFNVCLPTALVAETWADMACDAIEIASPCDRSIHDVDGIAIQLRP